MSDRSPSIEELFGRVLEVDAARLTDASAQASVESWDSLRHLEVVAALEEIYRVRLSAREIRAVTSIGEARALLRRKGVKV